MDLHALNAKVSRMPVDELRMTLRSLSLATEGREDVLRSRLQSYYARAARETKAARKREAERRAVSDTRKWKYFCVIDFEATCEDGRNFDFDNEIIEFPAVLIDAATGEEVDAFHMYVRPTLNPQLSEFCTTLTGITQEQVDKAETFPVVLSAFEAWLDKHGLLDNTDVAFATDGPWDLRDFMRKQLLISALKRPAYFNEWINIRKIFSSFFELNKTISLQSMLDHLGMEFEGRPHSGIDDTRNIARILAELLKRGASIRINDSMVKQQQFLQDKAIEAAARRKEKASKADETERGNS